jgi:hypothetical protein
MKSSTSMTFLNISTTTHELNFLPSNLSMMVTIGRGISIGEFYFSIIVVIPLQEGFWTIELQNNIDPK